MGSQKVLVAGTGISGIAAGKLFFGKGGGGGVFDGNEKMGVEGMKKKV